MTLSGFQPWVFGLLSASALLTGIPVIADDGTYPATPTREAALKNQGVAIIVLQIESAGIVESTPHGDYIQAIYLPVVIEENVTVNQETNAGQGTRQTAEMILENVQKSLAKQRDNQTILLPFDEPFKNLGKENGVQRYIVNFKILKRN